MSDLVIEQLQREGIGPIDLGVYAGTTCCLYGDSGSGKTLLLRAIADLDPNRARIRLGEAVRDDMPAYVPSEAGVPVIWVSHAAEQRARLGHDTSGPSG